MKTMTQIRQKSRWKRLVCKANLQKKQPCENTLIGGIYYLQRSNRHNREFDSVYRTICRAWIPAGCGFLFYNKPKNSMENDLWMMIYDDSVVHYGSLTLVDDAPGGTYVVLSKYQLLDMTGAIVKDDSNDAEVRMMFDLSKFEKFKLIKPRRF